MLQTIQSSSDYKFYILQFQVQGTLSLLCWHLTYLSRRNKSKLFAPYFSYHQFQKMKLSLFCKFHFLVGDAACIFPVKLNKAKM